MARKVIIAGVLAFGLYGLYSVTQGDSSPRIAPQPVAASMALPAAPVGWCGSGITFDTPPAATCPQTWRGTTLVRSTALSSNETDIALNRCIQSRIERHNRANGSTGLESGGEAIRFCETAIRRGGS